MELEHSQSAEYEVNYLNTNINCTPQLDSSYHVDSFPPATDHPRGYLVEHLQYDLRRDQRYRQNSTNMSFVVAQDVNPYLPLDYRPIPSSNSHDNLFDMIDGGLDLASGAGTPLIHAPGQDGKHTVDVNSVHPWQLGASIRYHLKSTDEPRKDDDEEFETASSELDRQRQDSSASTIPTLPLSSDSTSTSLDSPADQTNNATSTKHHRERNRIAARKCRQKAKQSVSKLQQRERDLHERNKMLLNYAASLREEILYLKNEILRHSDCNSSLIQEYITNAARRQMG